MKYSTYFLLVNYITINESNAADCEGPLTPKTLMDNMFYQEVDNPNEGDKDFEDEGNLN